MRKMREDMMRRREAACLGEEEVEGSVLSLRVENWRMEVSIAG